MNITVSIFTPPHKGLVARTERSSAQRQHERASRPVSDHFLHYYYYYYYY